MWQDLELKGYVWKSTYYDLFHNLCNDIGLIYKAVERNILKNCLICIFLINSMSIINFNTDKPVHMSL